MTTNTAQPAPKYWFRAKRYGWGWGLPTAWQGWVALAVHLGLVLLGLYLFPPNKAFASFIVYAAIVSALFFGVAYLKGEPLRWRWGDRD